MDRNLKKALHLLDAARTLLDNGRFSAARATTIERWRAEVEALERLVEPVPACFHGNMCSCGGDQTKSALHQGDPPKERT